MHDVLFPVQPDFEAGSAAPVRAMIDALLEALPVPVTGIARGLIVSWNAAAQEGFGFSREETIGRPLAAGVPPALVEEALAEVTRALRGAPAAAHQTEQLRKDGAPISVTVTHVPLRDGTGTVLEVAGLDRDERSRSEDAFRALVEGCPEPIFVDQQG